MNEDELLDRLRSADESEAMRMTQLDDLPDRVLEELAASDSEGVLMMLTIRRDAPAAIVRRLEADEDVRRREGRSFGLDGNIGNMEAASDAYRLRMVLEDLHWDRLEETLESLGVDREVRARVFSMKEAGSTETLDAVLRRASSEVRRAD